MSLDGNLDVNHVLRGKITGVSSLSVDNSLSFEGAAAEAKATGEAINAVKEVVDAHVLSKENPHNITKIEIGLGDVDNTADIEKPISKAQAEALAKKVDKEPLKGLSTNDFTDEYREKLDGIEAGANKYSLAIEDGYITNSMFADKALSAAKVADDARTQHYTVEIPASWLGDAAPYTQAVTVEGILNSDIPKVFFSSPDSYDDLEAHQAAFAMLYDVVSADGSVTFYAKDKPEIAFKVLIEVSRI